MALESLPKNLSELEALDRLNQFGRNELPRPNKISFFMKYTPLLKEPMIILLIAASIIYMIMGDLGEGILLGSFVLIILAISIYQEGKAQKALEALRELSSPRTLVIRDGIEKRIPSSEIVPDDLILLHEGDRVPADGVILQSSHLSIDESLFTGESFPVKNPKNFYSSTLIVGGSGLGKVLKTGIHTEVGKIGKILNEPKSDELNLNKEISKIVRLFAWGGTIICIAIILIYGFTRGVWIEAFLVGLSTQMSLLPEEFPVVLTIFLAMGAWRLSKVQILIRHPVSIERLGAVNILCVDKTGTITQNKMSVAELKISNQLLIIDSINTKNLDEAFHEIVEYGVLSSHRDPFDPMEKAIRRLVEDHEWGKDHLHRDWNLVRDYPLSDQLLAMSSVWKNPDLEDYVIATKGAPEAILDLCHLDSVQSKKIIEDSKEMARKGLRVLGVAKATFTKITLPENQHEFDFKWIGLIGLEDPIRPEVPAAVELCRKAGIRVMMMTGDYPETALKIAKQAGMDTIDALITGKEMDTFSDEELINRLKKAHVFARMIPEQKLRIVNALKSTGLIVAMTGDGVNDAPSLKSANIGIAMGLRGTDVAREASDIVLMDDNFASIVSGIERGRLIFSNIKKAMSYIASIHVPIAGLSIIPVIFKWPLILMPIHIVFLQLIIDPACSLLFESQTSEKGSMNSPPRNINEKLFAKKDLIRSFSQGLLLMFATITIFWLCANVYKVESNRARALVFVVLTLSNIGFIFADMSGGSIKQLALLFKKTSNLIIIFGLLMSLILINHIEKVRSIFHFGLISLTQFLLAIGVSILIFLMISFWNSMSLIPNDNRDPKNYK